MYCGVCDFVADELHINSEFAEGEEVIIIKTDALDIVEKVAYYFSNLDKLYEVSVKGQEKALKLYDIDSHITGRLNLFAELMKEEKQEKQK